MQKKAVYITKDRKAYFGNDALMELKKKNDLSYITKEGITHIDQERWGEAQEYERKIWMRDYLNAKSDQNLAKKDNLNNYRIVKGRRFERGIELGCGPFTNIRYLAGIAKISEIHLLDPLINDYLKHPNCYYKDKKLKVDRFLGMRRLIPAIIHESSIEEFETSEKFDLIIMIDVLGHCFNAKRVFDKILEISADNSIFIFGDKLCHAEELSTLLRYRYDAGHPLRVDQKVIDSFLSENFNTLFYKKNHVTTKKTRSFLTDWDEIYFIGELIKNEKI